MTTGFPRNAVIKALAKADGFRLWLRGELVEVELAQARDMTGFCYGTAGSHYFVNFLKEYEAKPGRALSDQSLLNRFYAAYRPDEMPDLGSIEQARLAFRGHSMFATGPRKEVAALQTGAGQALEEERIGDRHWFGPHSAEYIEVEKKRSIELYESIKRNGYRPDRFGGGYVRGYFVSDGNQSIFMVVGGHHRMAALSALKYRRLTCRYQPGFPKVATREDALRFADRVGAISREGVDGWFREMFDDAPRSKQPWLEILRTYGDRP